MTVQQHGAGWRITFENTAEIVTIDVSTAKLNAWARELAATTAAVMAIADTAAGDRNR